MDEQNAPIFSQAKLEYTNQLIDILTPQLFDGIKSIYDEAKTVNNVNRTQSITLLFRNFLEKVPSWSSVIIETETDRIIKMSDCDWLDDLITAVFISHTKILTSIGTNTSNTNIDLIIPKTINFIHKCYINIAREMWKNPYLYNENVIASEYQKNMRTVEITIKESIENTIRQLLPIKEILKQNLDIHENKQNDVKKQINQGDIRQMLIEEIRNLNLIKSEEDEDEIVKEEKDEDEIVKEEKDEDEIVKEEKDEDEIDDDYVSVDEETIKKNCDNLDINTINDHIEEELYDNAEIIEKKPEEEKTILEKFIQNLIPANTEEDKDEEEVEEQMDKEKSTIIENIEPTLSPKRDEMKEEVQEVKEVEGVKEVKEVKEDKNEKIEEVHQPVDTFKEDTIEKKSEKELISVEKISDNETVDEFFSDVSKIMETKNGISINKNPEKYTLFDDAENNEY